MKKSPLAGLVIRTAVVQRPGLGYIYACDPKREEKNIPHAITFIWEDGTFDRGECNYDASSICLIDKPESGLVDISEPGYYSANTEGGMTTGDILARSRPAPREPRHGGFRTVAAIAGKAYAVGLGGMVYRLDKVDLWTRIDEGLPSDFDVEGIDGYEESEIYAVGGDGQLWRHNGRKWIKEELPTNANLNEVTCAGNGVVYIAGMDAIMLRGRRDSWEIIDHEETDKDMWDLEWFKGNLYVSTMKTVYRLKKDNLEEVDFGDARPKTCNQLSSARGVLWSVGHYDIVSFDGSSWTRAV